MQYRLLLITKKGIKCVQVSFNTPITALNAKLVLKQLEEKEPDILDFIIAPITSSHEIEDLSISLKQAFGTAISLDKNIDQMEKAIQILDDNALSYQ